MSAGATELVRASAGVAERLDLLAPLHRRAAIERARRAAGLPRGPQPSLTELRIAEHPPMPRWRTSHASPCPPPTRADVAAEAMKLLADLEWRTAQPMTSHGDIHRCARREAETRLHQAWRAATAGPLMWREVENQEEVERGQALAGRHAPLLAALGELLDGLEQWIPGSALAAMPEDRVRALAAERADDARAAWTARGEARLGAWRAPRRARLRCWWDQADEAVYVDELPPLDDLREFLAAYPPPPEPLELSPDARRRQDRAWHRREIRKRAGEARQHLAAALGTVGRGAAPYADDYSLARRREQDEAAAAWAALRAWIPPGGGEPVPLPQILSASQQATITRLRCVTSGIDEAATRQGLRPIMVTLTLPGRWHPNPKRGQLTWTTDLSPVQADAALRATWKRFRARLSKSSVATLGLRVWEPHEDGCPHAHALLYVREDQVDTVDRHLRAVCPEPEGAAILARPRVASDLRRLDGGAGAVTYVMVYLRKTIAAPVTPDDDARGGGRDQRADDHLHGANHDRVRAWRSERRLRGFALLGVHGCTQVWQRLATASEEEMEAAPAEAARVQAAWLALKEHRYGDALEAIGAMRGEQAHGRLRLEYQTEQVDPETGEATPITTRYGEQARRAAWVVDEDSPGWRLRLRRGGTIDRVPMADDEQHRRGEQQAEQRARERAADDARIDADMLAVAGTRGMAGRENPHEIKVVTLTETYPRAGATPRPPAFGWPGPGALPGVPGAARPPPVAQGPPPSPRSPRRSSLPTLLAALSEAA